MPPKAIINGQKGPFFGGNDFSFNSRHGFSLNYPWRGTVSTMAAQAFQLALQRVPFRFKQEGQMASIILDGNTPIEPGQVETPQDNWQLDGNEVTKTWDQNPNALLMEALNPGAISAITYDLNQLQANGSADNLPNLITGPAASSFITNGEARAIWQALWPILRKTNQDVYGASQTVLKHSQTVSDNYIGEGFNFQNVDEFYTTAQLVEECAQFPYPLPACYARMIANLPSTPVVAGYAWGWLKKSATFRTIARFRTEIQTEYWYDNWPLAYYGTIPGNPFASPPD